MPFPLDYRHIVARQATGTPVPTVPTLAGTTILDVSAAVTVLSGFSVGTDSLLATPSLSPSSVLPTESATSEPQPIPTRILVAVCVTAGVLLGGIIIFVLWWERSKKKAPEQSPVDENYSQDASIHDVKLRGIHAAPPPPISSLRRPSSVGTTAYDHGYKAGYDHEVKQSFDATLPAIGSIHVQEDSFLSLKSTQFGTRPQTASPSTPPHSAPQSPRSASAQPITHPYIVGSHPYASPSISHAPLFRPSFERTATSTTAIATDLNLSTRLGPNAVGFAGAGARPGYDAYGLELRTPVAPSSGTILHRPSIDSIRSVARKAAQSSVPSEPVYPPTGGSTRTRNNSTSTYAGSVRAGKAKPTKEEKAKEMAAMDHLIAALDENAEAERRRKERLVAAAGIVDRPPSSSKNAAGPSRRKDTAITGSYPLPPPEVFRAALSSRGRGDDDLDDDEIERWRRS